MLNLMIMRHGKSDWNAETADDHSRPLNQRGVTSSERMGEVVRDLGLVPDIVVSSSARRARGTAELARIAGGWDSRLVLEDGLYGASVSESLQIVNQFAEEHSRVMLVGHEPTWSMLVKHLTGASVAMKTAAIADIELPISSWATISDSKGRLVTLLQSRHFISQD